MYYLFLKEKQNHFMSFIIIDLTCLLLVKILNWFKYQFTEILTLNLLCSSNKPKKTDFTWKYPNG